MAPKNINIDEIDLASFNAFGFEIGTILGTCISPDMEGEADAMIQNLLRHLEQAPLPAKALLERFVGGYVEAWDARTFGRH